MKEDSKNDLFEKAAYSQGLFHFCPVVFSMVVSLVYNMRGYLFYSPRPEIQIWWREFL